MCIYSFRMIYIWINKQILSFKHIFIVWKITNLIDYSVWMSTNTVNDPCDWLSVNSCVQVRARYEKVLEEVTRYAPRYMEEMESIFDQSQEEERKRISFLKQAFLSIHRHLDVTNNERWLRRVIQVKISIFSSQWVIY